MIGLEFKIYIYKACILSQVLYNILHPSVHLNPIGHDYSYFTDKLENSPKPVHWLEVRVLVQNYLTAQQRDRFIMAKLQIYIL